MSISCISKSLDSLHCVSLGKAQRILDALPQLLFASVRLDLKLFLAVFFIGNGEFSACGPVQH